MAHPPFERYVAAAHWYVIELFRRLSIVCLETDSAGGLARYATLHDLLRIRLQELEARIIKNGEASEGNGVTGIVRVFRNASAID